MGPPHTPTCHVVTLLSADFGCRLQSLHSHLDMLRLGQHTVASLSPVVPDLRLPAAWALRYQVCSAGDSCDIKGLRRGQLRYQGTPQGTAATSRDSAGDSCDIKGLRRGQLRYQGTPQGTAAISRDSAGDSCDTKGLRRGALRYQGTLAKCRHLYAVLGTSIQFSL
ncbi:hypothetical protein N7466_001414 [Penicillium verhagenii]|uniref:uncharacterized protein n=1 Tax=Penicillium verhagenii TaxID=1562060 RepID=UPI002545426C|nr:uncharacterized protein N7466_001414 [Penicillium verhagenii]KAJ5938280.1 hypothetical protein N7466_001414 [Penicillium verhagenii]